MEKGMNAKPRWKIEDQEWWQKYSAMVHAQGIQVEKQSSSAMSIAASSGVKYVGSGSGSLGFQYVGSGSGSLGFKYTGSGSGSLGIRYMGSGSGSLGIRYVGSGSGSLAIRFVGSDSNFHGIKYAKTYQGPIHAKQEEQEVEIAELRPEQIAEQVAEQISERIAEQKMAQPQTMEEVLANMFTGSGSTYKYYGMGSGTDEGQAVLAYGLDLI